MAVLLLQPLKFLTVPIFARSSYWFYKDENKVKTNKNLRQGSRPKKYFLKNPRELSIIRTLSHLFFWLEIVIFSYISM